MNVKQNLLAVFFLLIFANLGFSQPSPSVNDQSKSDQTSSNLLEKVNLKFDLTGNPIPKDVGFDNPKSVWKLKYELRLLNQDGVRALQVNLYVNCKNDSPEYQKCMSKANKKLSKGYAQSALLIAKGEFQRIGLMSQTNRETTIPIKFAPEIVSIFNKAAELQDNPVFILHIRSKTLGKISTQNKLKFKRSIRFEFPLKLQKKDGSFDFYNITNFGASVIVSKEDDGTFHYGIFKN